MTFAEVFSLPIGTIVDVAAVVCDVGPVDHYANFPNSVREVALMDSNYQVAFLRAFDEVTDFYQSQLITSETRRGIVVATALEVDKASKVRNSLFKEPVLHDTITIGVTFRKQELLQMAEQNNASGEPEVVIVEDDEVVIEPVPKNRALPTRHSLPLQELKSLIYPPPLRHNNNRRKCAQLNNFKIFPQNNVHQQTS